MTIQRSVIAVAASRVLRVALGARDPVERLFTPAWPGGFRAAEQARVN